MRLSLAIRQSLKCWLRTAALSWLRMSRDSFPGNFAKAKISEVCSINRHKMKNLNSIFSIDSKETPSLKKWYLAPFHPTNSFKVLISPSNPKNHLLFSRIKSHKAKINFRKIRRKKTKSRRKIPHKKKSKPPLKTDAKTSSKCTNLSLKTRPNLSHYLPLSFTEKLEKVRLVKFLLSKKPPNQISSTPSKPSKSKRLSELHFTGTFKLRKRSWAISAIPLSSSSIVHFKLKRIFFW